MLWHWVGAADARHWAAHVAEQCRMMLLAEGAETTLTKVTGAEGAVEVKVVR